MNTIVIMSSIHLTVKENVVISQSDPIQPDQGNEIEIRPINEDNHEEVIEECRRLVEVRMKYNIHTPPKPDHIKWEDYGFEKKAEYKAAKDKHYKDYKTKCQTVERNIAHLHNLNTALCYKNKAVEDEIKIKNGTFYNADEKEELEQLHKEKAARRREVSNESSRVYYQKNKETVKIKRKIKEHQTALKEIEKKKCKDAEGFLANRIKGVVIKPLCLCGKTCDLIKFKSLRTHSNIEKHQLFKSIIALIHYKRRNGAKLKTIIDKLNSDYVDYKRVVREKRNGKSYTITNKTDKEIIQLYGDYLNPMDENETHQPRKSYIEKVEYTNSYKNKVMYRTFMKHKALYK